MAPILRKTLVSFSAIPPLSKLFAHPGNPNRVSHNLAPITFSGISFSGNSPSALFISSMSGLRSDFIDKCFGFRPVGAVSDGGHGGHGGHGGFGGWDRNGGSGGGGDENGGSSSIFSWYSMALDRHPVFTKAITSALLTFIGDLICQLVIEQVSKLDIKRTLIFTLLGFGLVGPTLHFWYLSLSKSVTIKGASGAFLRLLLDQFLFSPIFIGVFLSSVVTLEGRPSQVVPKLKQEWFSSVIANWQLWIPFQFLNFRFVPQQYQVLVANIVALAWNVILSFKAHRAVVLK